MLSKKQYLTLFSCTFFSLILLALAFNHSLRQIIIQFVAAHKNINPIFWDEWIKTRTFLMFFYMIIGFSWCFFLKQKKVILLFNTPIFFYFFYFFILIIFHFFMPFVGDDLTFQHVLNQQHVFEWIDNRYQNWSGRVTIEFLVAILPYYPYFIFKVLNIFIWGIIFISLNYLLNKENTIKNKILLIFLLLLFPFWQLNSAGWIATALNYLWPVAGILYIFQLHFKQNKNYLEYILAFFLLSISSSQEQSNIILLFLSFFFIFHAVLKNQFSFKKYAFLIFVFCFSFFMLIVILKSPGNVARYQIALQAWPAFTQFNLAQKIWLACVPSLGIFNQEKLLLSLLSGLIFARALLEKENKIIVLALIPLAFSIVFSLFSGFFSIFFNFIAQINAHFKTWHLQPSFSFYFIFSFIITFIHFAILIYLTGRFLGKFWAMIFILGLFTRFLIGFSPTIYVSAERTTIFAYFSLICIIFLMCQSLKINRFFFISLSFIVVFNILFNLDRINQSLWFNFNWLDVELFLLIFTTVNLFFFSQFWFKKNA